MKKTLTIGFILISGLIAFKPNDPMYDNFASMGDVEFLNMAATAQNITLNAKEIVDFRDSSWRYELEASAFDTLGYTFPAKTITVGPLFLITNAAHRDSVDNTPVLFSITNSVRQGHNFWFSN